MYQINQSINKYIYNGKYICISIEYIGIYSFFVYAFFECIYVNRHTHIHSYKS